MKKDAEKKDADPILTCVARAIPNVAALLHYTLEDGYMDDYDASLKAKEALDELLKALEHMNVG